MTAIAIEVRLSSSVAGISTHVALLLFRLFDIHSPLLHPVSRLDNMLGYVSLMYVDTLRLLRES